MDERYILGVVEDMLIIYLLNLFLPTRFDFKICLHTKAFC